MNHDLEKKVAIGLALTILLIILMGVYFVTEPARQRSAREEFTRKASVVGAEHFLVTCAQCHGAQGEGGIGPSLRDTELEEDALVKTISRGLPGTPMPAFAADEGGVFTFYEIRDIAEFIRHWDDDILDEVRLELLEHGVLTSTPTPAPPSAAGPDGLQLFKQLGCAACHTIEGVSTSAAGPELTHIGTDAGQRVPGTAASDYIEESLLDPGAFVVKGFAPIMSSFESRMSPEELQALVDYLLGLGDTGAAPSPTKTPAATPGPTPAPSPTPTSTASPAPAAPDTAAGKKVFQQLACGACHTVEGISTSAVGPELTHIGSDAGQRVPGTSASDYMEESLLDPGAFVVAGFAPMMPSVDGRLAPEELQALLDFLLSLE